jgi:hypothetical protein
MENIMKTNSLVKFKHPIKEEDEEGLVMKVIWIDSPRVMVECLMNLPINPSKVYNIKDLELLNQ